MRVALLRLPADVNTVAATVNALSAKWGEKLRIRSVRDDNGIEWAEFFTRTAEKP